MLHFTNMSNPSAISIFIHIWRMMFSVASMSPDFLWNNSRRLRTVAHINCAHKQSGLRLLVLLRYLFLSHWGMYPPSKAAQQEHFPDLHRRGSWPSNVAQTSHTSHTWNWTKWNVGGCSTWLTLLQAIVKQRLLLMNKGVLKCNLKYSLLSAMLHMKSTFFFF